MTHPNTLPDAARHARGALLRRALPPFAALVLAAAGLCAAPPALALTVANVDVPEQQSVAPAAGEIMRGQDG